MWKLDIFKMHCTTMFIFLKFWTISFNWYNFLTFFLFYPHIFLFFNFFFWQTCIGIVLDFAFHLFINNHVLPPHTQLVNHTPSWLSCDGPFASNRNDLGVNKNHNIWFSVLWLVIYHPHIKIIIKGGCIISTITLKNEKSCMRACYHPHISIYLY